MFFDSIILPCTRLSLRPQLDMAFVSGGIVVPIAEQLNTFFIPTKSTARPTYVLS